jgi:uncharacterized protein YciI
VLKTLVASILLAGCAAAQAPPAKQFLLRVEVVRKDFTFQNITPDEMKIAGAHMAYLRSLEAEGKLTYAGQVFDPKGLWGITVVNAPAAEAAEALLEADPAVKAGFFRGEVIPFRAVLTGRPVPAAQ